MKVRWVGLVAVLALAAGLLSSCRTNVGVAARVDGHAISEDAVNNYVSDQQRDSTSPYQPARVLILSSLVQQSIVRRVLDDNGGAPTATELASVPAFTSTEATKIKSVLSQAGVRESLYSVVVAVQKMANLLASRTGSTDVKTVLIKNAGHVQVNPRFGEWNLTDFQVENGAEPSYLQLQSSLGTTGG